MKGYATIHNTKAEAGALACVLSANGDAERMLEQIVESDLYDERHIVIFRALISLQFDGKPLDIVNLDQRLRDDGTLNHAGGGEFVQSLPDKTPSAANFPTFIEMVKDRARRRKMYEDGQALLEAAVDMGTPLAPVTPKAIATVVSKLLSEFVNHGRNDPQELFKFRYLCRCAAILLCAQTGAGKSAFIMQAIILWSLGRESFGITPARPLKTVMIQAENDDGDIAEMRDGVYEGLQLTKEERATAGSSVIIIQEDASTGILFLNDTVKKALHQHRPDLLVIDPALSYIGGESNSQKDVGGFLRNGLNPLLREFNCGCIVVHHTNKPPKGKEKSDWQAGDLAYLGAGSAEWANWARAVLSIRSIGSHEVFELNAGKRGARLGWTDADGNKAFSKYIAHSKQPGVICWHEVDAEDVSQGGAPKKYDVGEMLALLPDSGLPAGEWQKLAKSECGISEATFHRERRALQKADRIIKSKVSGNWQPIKKT